MSGSPISRDTSWTEPFLGHMSEPVTRYHDNPLFKSSPTDDLLGIQRELDFSFEDDDSKENRTDGCVNGSTKVMVKSPLTRTCKRILGERNGFQQEQQDFCNINEPPSSIRALSFPSAHPASTNSEENSSSSWSSSPPSPTSRFQLSPLQCASPTLSESSSGSLEGQNYDPKVNLRTPRPKFLRYRPEWRLEFLSSLELREGESLANAIESSRQGDTRRMSGPAFGDAETKGEAVTEDLVSANPDGGSEKTLDAPVISGTEDASKGMDGKDEAKENARAEGTEGTIWEVVLNSDIKSTQNTEQLQVLNDVDELENRNPAANKTVEEDRTGSGADNKPTFAEDTDFDFEEDDDDLSSSATPISAVLAMLLLGTVATLALLTAGSPGLLPQAAQGNYLSTLWQKCRYRKVFTEVDWYSDKDISTDNHFSGEVEDWEWYPDYDIISDHFENLTMGFSTDSAELDALLAAIMFGSDEEIHHKYLELMEHEQVDLYYFDQIFDEIHDAASFSDEADSAADDESSGYVMIDEDEDARAVGSNADSIEEDIVYGDETIKDVRADMLQQYSAQALEEVEVEQITSLAWSIPLSMVVAVFLGVPAILLFIKKHARSIMRRGGASKLKEARLVARPMPVTGTDLPATPTKPKQIEDLFLSPECLQAAPYGSFTAYKKKVVNEGSDKEKVVYTPVRRSSRIRSHCTKSSPTPVARRVLLSPA